MKPALRSAASGGNASGPTSAVATNELAAPDLRATTRLSPSAELRLQENLCGIRSKVDIFFGVLLLVEWLGLIVIAAATTPVTWEGPESRIHPHVFSAILLGCTITVPALAVLRRHPGTALARHSAALSQSLMSALLIHMTGGRIESHFHVFGSLACLSFYRDWRVLITATAVTGVDHAVRGIFWPASVFGIASVDLWRWFEHVCWVLYEDLFLFVSCRLSLREMSVIARREAESADAAVRMEQEIGDRTNALRESELRLRREYERSEAANFAKSEFLANMSHEIRTPMTAILGYADLLLEMGDIGRAPLDRVEAIETIRRNGNHLLTLINDILDLSRIESGKLTLEPVACSPAAILKDVATLMRVRADGKGISLDTGCVGPVPALIKTDPTRIRQILVNLLGNAIKFTEVGSVRVTLRYDAETSQLEFDVIDTGIGIAPARLERLFEPFVQADNSTTRRFGGTGLGLTISRRLAGVLGGDLQFVYSRPGEGTCIRLTLPCKLVAQAAASSDRKPSPQATAPDDAAIRAAMPESGTRILVAEDGPDNQRLLRHYLRKAGFEVVLVDNGQDAVDEALRAEDAGSPFAVIVMDMQMPILDGYEATAVLRRRGYRRPIVAATAHTMVGDRAKCLDFGCDDYIPKPFERRSLIELLTSYASRQPDRLCGVATDDDSSAARQVEVCSDVS
jgi:signal transduction histidine kinase/FixJ family two-component response regulator